MKNKYGNLGTPYQFFYFFGLPPFCGLNTLPSFSSNCPTNLLLPNDRPFIAVKKGHRIALQPFLLSRANALNSSVCLSSGKKPITLNAYAVASSTSSSISSNCRAPLVHHLTHDGSGGSPHKSHFKGTSVPGSKKNGFSGHAARHNVHSS